MKVVYGKAALGVPATLDYGAVAQEVLASNAGKSPDAVFVVGNASNVLGMQQALGAAGFLGVFTNQIEYGPNLVAPANGAMVMTQTAPTESAPTNPAMAQLVADVQKVAPGFPIDQSVIVGYWSADLFLAAVQKAGKNLTRASLVKAANHNFTYKVANTVGPTTFPAAHSLPHTVRRARGEQRHRVRGEGPVHVWPRRRGQMRGCRCRVDDDEDSRRVSRRRRGGSRPSWSPGTRRSSRRSSRRGCRSPRTSRGCAASSTARPMPLRIASSMPSADEPTISEIL